MSYTQKQQGSGGSGGQSQQQAAKSLAGINQQMQNLVHGQNNLPQAAAQAAFANLNMTLQQQQQQQRFESLFKQQQLLFGANHPQFQQHFQQQMQQTATKEPLALTRSPADLLNKKQQHHQQQANGSTSVPTLAGNLTNQQLQQQLQALSQAPANLMQQLQAYHQMQQQQNQKMLSSLNQAQSLSIQQQHMQQLQQTLQQQKMMASHSKSMSSGAQMKLAVVSNPPATQTVQSNNNLPNKVGNKTGTVATGPQGKQQQTTAQGSPKNAPNQNFGKSAAGPVSGDKTAASPQLATKPAPVSTQKINAIPLAKPLSKPSTPPNKSPIVAASPSPVKVGISPSSSPKPVATSGAATATAKASTATVVPIPAAIATASPTTPVNDTAIKNPPPGLTITPSQGPSVTAPSAIPPKPFTQPVTAPVRASTVEPEPEPEPKKAEEPKPEEEKVAPPQEAAKEDKTEVVVDEKEKEKEKPKPEEPAPVEESKEDVKEAEEISEVAIEENDDKPENEVPEKEKSLTEEDAVQDNTNSSSTEASSEESLAKPEVSAEEPTSTVKATATATAATAAAVKPKSNQRKSIQTSEEVVQKEQPPPPPPPPPPQKPERKRPVREVSKPEKLQKVISPGTPKNSDDRRSKRHRLKTILYQSPLPELAFIAKLSASEASCSPKNTDEKLIIFYKNEYLAVRNAEGGFFLCQTLQNVYKTSPRIRIRWLSEEKKESNVYIPDFYDNTDIECVLTTVEMEKVNKTSIRLPKAERSRIENILKKAIDVEKGVLPRPNVTEENPDGLDISLYKNESQIEKKTPLRKRKLSLSHSSKKSHSKPKSPKKKKRTRPIKDHGSSESSEEDSEDEETDNDQEYKPSRKRDLDTQPKLRAQRSPLARARAASPITMREHSTRTRTSIVPDKSIAEENNKEETEVTLTAVSRSDRAKRRATESGGTVEEEVPTKKPVSKKIETKSPGKGKTSKSEDEAIIVLEVSKSMPETIEPVAKSSKAESSESTAKSAKIVVSSVSAKKSKSSPLSSSVESTAVATQSASGGRTTRSRK